MGSVFRRKEGDAKVIRYKCPKCGGDQYSADPKKANESCIYCGHKGTEMMDNINEDQEEPKEETK